MDSSVSAPPTNALNAEDKVEPNLSDESGVSIVRDLESRIRQDGIRNANTLNELLRIVRNKGFKTSDEEDVDVSEGVRSKAIHATRRVLGVLEKQASTDKVRTWLTERRKQYGEALVTILKSPAQSALHQASIASSALTHPSVFEFVIRAVLSTPSLTSASLVYDMISKYPDLTVVALRVLAEDQSKLIDISRRVTLLLACNAPLQDSGARTTVSAKEYKAAVRDAWLTILEADALSVKQRAILLQAMPKQLLPYMHDPLRLSDFLTLCFDSSIGIDLSVSLASLDALYILISKHGLDYPRFYHRLYSLLTPTALSRVETRHRFLQLMSEFLKRGSRLPSSLVAAFVKRLVRRALTAPTSAALWALRLALDLLYAHPAVSFLVHRSVNLFDDGASVGEKRKRSTESSFSNKTDPFDDSQSDPEKSCVVDSSLWELEVLSSHLSPAVTRLVSLFSNDVRSKPAPLPGTLSDYAALSFSDVFQAEIKRKIKAVHVAYDVPGSAIHSTKLQGNLSSALTWS